MGFYLRHTLCLLMAAAAHLPAAALDNAGDTARPTFSLVVENDLFGQEDRHYTSGLRLSWMTPGQSAPRWSRRLAHLLPMFPKDSEPVVGYALGQSLFTPTDITVADPPLDERPYAGWLYGTIAIGAENGRQLDQLLLTVGIIGPSALGEQSQKLIHKLTGADKPEGWDTQLRDEPGVVLSYQRTWRPAEYDSAGYAVDFLPHVGATVGNVFTYVNAGATVRAGYNLPHDYGPPRIQPSVPGSAFSVLSGDFGWYVFFGFEGRAVARNVFLDGNSFRNSRSVDRKTLVGDFHFGVVFAWQRLRLAYTHVLRTKEYHGQDSEDDFGALSISIPF